MNMHRRRINVLRRARDNLVRYGWVQGVLGSRQHGFCARGAIHAATRSDEFRIGAGGALKDTIGGRWNYSISTWNDETRRTKEQVIRAFDRTIKRLEKEAAAT